MPTLSSPLRLGRSPRSPMSPTTYNIAIYVCVLVGAGNQMRRQQPQRGDFAANYVTTLSRQIKWKLYCWEYIARHIVR